MISWNTYGYDNSQNGPCSSLGSRFRVEQRPTGSQDSGSSFVSRQCYCTQAESMATNRISRIMCDPAEKRSHQSFAAASCRRLCGDWSIAANKGWFNKRFQGPRYLILQYITVLYYPTPNKISRAIRKVVSTDNLPSMEYIIRSGNIICVFSSKRKVTPTSCP